MVGLFTKPKLKRYDYGDQGVLFWDGKSKWTHAVRLTGRLYIRSGTGTKECATIGEWNQNTKVDCLDRDSEEKCEKKLAALEEAAVTDQR